MRLAPASSDPPPGHGSPSAEAQQHAPGATTDDSDRTARARIRDAAIARFADDGVAATTLRAIAADAGVSAGLVIHHFGSKDALRVACDRYVAASVREQKRAAISQGAAMDPLAALRTAAAGPPLLRYLARTLADGSPHVCALLDEMVADAVEYLEDGVSQGTLKPTDDPLGRATILVMWSLGSLVLHEHVTRLLGVDLTGDPRELGRWAVPASEILASGVFDEKLYERVRDAFAAPGPSRDPQEVES